MNIEGGGFDPGSEVEIELQSDPIPLGTTTADANGNISVQVTLPLIPPGEHTIVAKGFRAGNPHEVRIPITISSPVVIALDRANPVEITVDDDGVSGLFVLGLQANEVYPGLTSAPLSVGDLSLTLVPIGPGGPVDPAWCEAETTDGIHLTCRFDVVPVNTYLVVGTASGEFIGRDEAVLVVSDPARGGVSGSGIVRWPDSGDETMFGFTMEYNKKGRNLKGSLLVIRESGEVQCPRRSRGERSLRGLRLGLVHRQGHLSGAGLGRTHRESFVHGVRGGS